MIVNAKVTTGVCEYERGENDGKTEDGGQRMFATT